MIEKLDKYNTSSAYAIIDKINEIIDFLNDTYLMKQKDGQYGVCTDALPFVTGLSMVDDTVQSDLEFVTTVTSDIKCPYCHESCYVIENDLNTFEYHPPVWKNATKVNSSQNKTTTHCRCLYCNKEFDI